MLAHSWRSSGRDVVEIPVDAERAAGSRNERRDSARRISEMVRAENPGLVVDVNGVGLLPLTDDADGPWTNQSVHGFWCPWWWDDPRRCFHPLRAAGEEEAFLRAWRHERTVHFIWDEVLGREYSTWTGKLFQWLPTATHAGIFNPEVIEEDEGDFAKVQLTFLGNCPVAPKKPYAFPDAEDVALMRIKSPELTYFNMREHDKEGLLAEFFNVLNHAQTDARGPLHPDVLVWKDLVDRIVGTRRRIRLLRTVSEHFKHTYFAGEQWTNEFTHHPAIYDPRKLVQRYRSSMVCLSVPGSGTFSGTSMRAYEIMACGGILLCPAGPDFDPLGRVAGQAYVGYRSPEDLIEQWGSYGTRSDRREEISRQARAYVLEHHTWSHRLHDMLQVLMRNYVKGKGNG
jgi:hypothetical protein